MWLLMEYGISVVGLKHGGNFVFCVRVYYTHGHATCTDFSAICELLVSHAPLHEIIYFVESDTQTCVCESDRTCAMVIILGSVVYL